MGCRRNHRRFHPMDRFPLRIGARNSEKTNIDFHDRYGGSGRRRSREPPSGRGVGEISYPQLVWPTRMERPVYQIKRPWITVTTEGRDGVPLASHNVSEANVARIRRSTVHQDPQDAVTLWLAPHLASTIDAEVFFPDAAGLVTPVGVSPGSGRQPFAFSLPSCVLVVGRRKIETIVAIGTTKRSLRPYRSTGLREPRGSRR